MDNYKNIELVKFNLVCLKNKMKSKFVNNIRKKFTGYLSDSSGSDEIIIMKSQDEAKCKKVSVSFNNKITEEEDILNTAFSADLDRSHIIPLAQALIELTEERIENLHF